MERSLEQVYQMYDKCCFEVERLKRNLTNLLEKNNKLLHEIDPVIQNKQSSVLAWMCYDQCWATLSHTADMAGKFNMVLEFSDIGQLETNNTLTLTQTPQTSKPKAALEATETLTIDPNHLKPNFKKYSNKSVLKATITHIENEEELVFYAWDRNNTNLQHITELRSALHLRQYVTPPDVGQLFGLVVDNSIFRAFLSKDKENTARLIDLGEDIAFDVQKDVCYQLPVTLQQLPCQVICCKLIGLVGKNCTTDRLKQYLSELQYNRATFLIEQATADILHVQLVEKLYEKPNVQNGVAESLEQKEENWLNHGVPLSAISSEIDDVDQMQNGLDAEQLDMLYEEPLGTTSAVKAVLGFVPTDDRRLCRFYDPKTGGCFKGTHCKLEHAPRCVDGVTSDVVVTNSAFDARQACLRFEKEQRINITVTYLCRLDAFYAQINHKSAMDLFIWQDKEIPSYKFLKKPPMPYDLVLVRYIDNMWYRAQVSHEMPDGKTYEVFFVDYGNRFVVSLQHMARCFALVAQQPFQAQLIHIAHVRDCAKSVTQRNLGINMLREELINKTFDVCVFSDYENLVVNFLNVSHIKLIQNFIKDGLLERHESIEI